MRVREVRNMEEVFTIQISSGETLKGRVFETENASRNLLIQTGMGEHSLRYADFAKYLNGLGFNVYVMDAVGQGLNAPRVEDQEKWMKGAFDKNVEALHQKIVEIKKNGLPTSLMGHSMGSFMTQRFLELYPGCLDSVVICGSNGPVKVKMTFAYLLAHMMVNEKNWDKHHPFLENAGLGPFIKAIKDRDDDLDWLSRNKDNIEVYRNDPYCGAPTTAGFWHEFIYGLKELYRKKYLKRISKDEHILIVSGEEDPVGEMGKGPRRLAKMYKKLGVKDVNIIMYPKLRHEILNEKEKDGIYADISSFLLKH